MVIRLKSLSIYTLFKETDAILCLALIATIYRLQYLALLGPK